MAHTRAIRNRMSLGQRSHGAPPPPGQHAGAHDPHTGPAAAAEEAGCNAWLMRWIDGAGSGIRGGLM